MAYVCCGERGLQGEKPQNSDSWGHVTLLCLSVPIYKMGFMISQLFTHTGF